MGSPIDSWEGAAAFFTGAGTAMPAIFLLLAVIATFGAIAWGAVQEESAHARHKKRK